MSTIDRRTLLRRGATAAAGSALIAGPMQALVARGALAEPGEAGRGIAARNGGYGALELKAPEGGGPTLLAVPPGFRYWAFGRTGDVMDDGIPTPDRHDGMAAFPVEGQPDLVRLIRNHERGYSAAEPLVGPAGPLTYDPVAAGGCTSLLWNTRTRRVERSLLSLNGTSVNCAGGPTPWGTWLTCEETTNGTADGFDEDHGYVFDIPFDGVATPQPLRAMGRFRHEAIAIDPATGTVYETEDSGDTSGFYRFVPDVPGDLASGGTLEMLAVVGEPQYDTTTGQSRGSSLRVTWVPIADPDPEDANSESVYLQGRALGGANFARLEGCWWADDAVYFNATSGGEARLGQVWEYRPATETLALVYQSTSSVSLDSPDNITVSPRGGLVLCEDGDDDQYLRGLTTGGEIFDLARNAVAGNEDREFAGACYSPDGAWLFFNIQTPGITFALTGPWERGAL